MKFGVREICDVVFKAKASVTIGGITFKPGQPVLYIDSAKTSVIEGAATTVYAQGGKGNARLIAWEGEKTMTFTVEDALLSPMGFAILSGAGLLKGKKETNKQVHVHTTTLGFADAEGAIDLTDALGAATKVDPDAKIWVMPLDASGGVTDAPVPGTYVAKTDSAPAQITSDIKESPVFIDYYTLKTADKVHELQIDMENFAGYYYVEASTLFRRQDNGKDVPAEITFPNVKIQSNFTFNMASTGDPSTFTFTMDAMPGYTMFNPARKVLCAIQIIDDLDDLEDIPTDLVTVFGADNKNEDGYPVD